MCCLNGCYDAAVSHTARIRGKGRTSDSACRNFLQNGSFVGMGGGSVGAWERGSVGAWERGSVGAWERGSGGAGGGERGGGSGDQPIRGAFASSWYGVPALAGLARHRPARWLANPGPRRLKPGLRTNNSRLRPQPAILIMPAPGGGVWPVPQGVSLTPPFMGV